jgi:hypothetical protein
MNAPKVIEIDYRMTVLCALVWYVTGKLFGFHVANQLSWGVTPAALAIYYAVKERCCLSSTLLPE